eukprot:TRINITY_DN6988_c0_g3_i1.p1 TRINITY_DN6988_c0_g3~~TRINITY_DN6988_c0_g3_i1.p1  ORF type:complete len:229 (+),score=6.96 TRINITY_DN6988_c0_g3_i1:197-883(+)
MLPNKVIIHANALPTVTPDLEIKLTLLLLLQLVKLPQLPLKVAQMVGELHQVIVLNVILPAVKLVLVIKPNVLNVLKMLQLSLLKLHVLLLKLKLSILSDTLMLVQLVMLMIVTLVKLAYQDVYLVKSPLLLLTVKLVPMDTSLLTNFVSSSIPPTNVMLPAKPVKLPLKIVPHVLMDMNGLPLILAHQNQKLLDVKMPPKPNVLNVLLVLSHLLTKNHVFVMTKNYG